MTTAIATTETAGALPKDQIDLVRRTVANGATDDELRLFLYDCQRRGVHPLDRLLHFTKRQGRYTPVTSIDFMRTQAAASGEMAGSDDPEFLGGPERPELARVTVYRITQGQRFAYTATARWSEYVPEAGPSGKGDIMWRKMPHTMLGKCAEALALRKAFPQQLAGLYTTDEMDQAGNAPPAPEPQRLQVQAESAVVVDTESGEELAAAPEGYHYLTGYTVKNEWHEAVALNWDLKGGSLQVATKRPQIGGLLGKAANEHLPVKLDVTMKKGTVGQGYVNEVTFYAPKPAPVPEVLTEPIKDSEIPF